VTVDEVTEPIRIGLLSTARINSRIIAAAQASEKVRCVAVASRDETRARAYAADHGLDRAYGSYEGLLADSEIDAVYISLPNHLHVDWATKTLEAGKHVLCEKPLSRRSSEVDAALAAAARADKLLVEGFMWRHHPQTATVKELIADGAIGRVVEVISAFQFDLELALREAAGVDGPVARPATDPRLVPEFDGGALMDVGTYCVNAIRTFAGEPIELSARQQLGETGVDLVFSAELTCGDGVRARFYSSLVDARAERLRIVGERGLLDVSTPFLCKDPGVRIERDGVDEFVPASPANPYQLELENLADVITGRALPLIDADDTLHQAVALEALTAAAEEAEAATTASAKKGHS
jgi:xylose dehydrogenase (NAD/NADP)